jgi:hypothetical protein
MPSSPSPSRETPSQNAPRRFARLLLPLALILFATSCDGFFVSNSTLVSLTVSPNAVLLKSGATPADTATLTPSGSTAGNGPATDFSSATWSSSNDAIVTAATGGVITAAASGTPNTPVTVTAKQDGVTSNSCNVVLYTGTEPTTLSITTQSGAINFAAGSSFQAYVTGSFSGDTTLSGTGALNPYVSWSTSDSTVATVSSSGVVTVLSSSQFTITATANFGTAATNSTVSVTSQEFNTASQF